MKRISRKRILRNAIRLADDIYKDCRYSEWNITPNMEKLDILFYTKYFSQVKTLRAKAFILCGIKVHDIGQDIPEVLIYLLQYVRYRPSNVVKYLKLLKKLDVPISIDGLRKFLERVFEIYPRITIEGDNITCCI